MNALILIGLVTFESDFGLDGSIASSCETETEILSTSEASNSDSADDVGLRWPTTVATFT